ncbi:TIGR02677 family protein [Catenulispora pinisilvae]|uniref:TIGR02677 family protein n=1 Tax=Catenulispora pinisilvae TaxID=2705253 RepID=UPI001892141C|nr:TIGR02677 family protein [Catenulispora pinisilvae]
MSAVPDRGGGGEQDWVGRRAELGTLLTYATAGVPHTQLYQRIMDVFLEGAAAYQSQMRPEDVHARLLESGWPTSLAVGDVEQRLGTLFEWGNLTQHFDDDGVATVDQYERNAYVYDLTPAGEIVHETIVSLEQNLRKVGGLQTVLLRQIVAVLDVLVEQLGSTTPDGEAVYTRAEELKAAFKALTGNAALFMQQVNRMLSVPRLTAQEFQSFKRDTIAYLAGFVAELDDLAPDIRERTRKLAAVEPLRRRANLRAGARASGQRAVDGRDVVTEWAEAAARQLEAVIAWFSDDPGAATGVGVLANRTRQAVHGVLRAAERIREAGTLPSARTGDLLQLARIFDEAPESELHHVWKAAFGLTPAAHLHDIHPDVDTVPAGIAAADAPAIAVTLRLKTNEHGETVRRAPNLADHSATKQLLAQDALQEIALAAATADTLTALGRIRLSQADLVLDRDTLKLLARLISRAEASEQNSEGWHSVASVDGRLRIRLRDPDPMAAACVKSPDGRWILPDYELEVIPTRRRPAP